MAKNKKHSKKKKGQKKCSLVGKSNTSNVSRENTNSFDVYEIFNSIHIRTNTTITRLLKKIYDDDSDKNIRYKALFCDNLTKRPISLTIFRSNGFREYCIVKYIIKYDAGRESLCTCILDSTEMLSRNAATLFGTADDNFTMLQNIPDDTFDKMLSETAPMLITNRFESLEIEALRYAAYCKDASGKEFIMQIGDKNK